MNTREYIEAINELLLYWPVLSLGTRSADFKLFFKKMWQTIKELSQYE